MRGVESERLLRNLSSFLFAVITTKKKMGLGSGSVKEHVFIIFVNPFRNERILDKAFYMSAVSLFFFFFCKSAKQP